MKKFLKRTCVILIAIIILFICFVGCSKKYRDVSVSTDVPSNEFSERVNVLSSNVETDMVLEDGAFDPKSIVTYDNIRYTYYSNTSGHYSNGSARPKIFFEEDFEIEILPGLFLKSKGKDSKILEVISNNKLLGMFEFNLVGESLAYGDIDKCTKNDVLKLVVIEHDDSVGLENNLKACGYVWVDVLEREFIVPDLGDDFEAADTITKDDLEYIISVANNENSIVSNNKNFSFNESPKIYKGVINSQSAVGDIVVLKLVYEQTYDSGFMRYYVLETNDLTKHVSGHATCTIISSNACYYGSKISEQEMVDLWSTDYVWEKVNY